ncbi:MAG: type I-U CRISPR-associated protein Csx17 [Candidatus Eisenbacteria bacterium]|nr:type I-U CRISPR-associated protein Csx17 [Candidatus Eisenbacteria bacterium]
MPLWSAPTTYPEIAALFSEGRAQLAGRPATRPLDFARALARLGVARGIDSFERYAYIERNGQANLAVPLGRWIVQPRPHQDLLDVVAPWVDNLRRAARDKNAPRRLQSLARACEEAMLACCRHSSGLYWRALLINLAEAEAALLQSPRFSKDRGLQPLPRLPLHFIDAASTALDPQSARELRLALSLASLHGPGPDLSDPIRRYWLPIDLKSHDDFPRFLTNAHALEDPPERVAGGSDLFLRTIPLVLRRRALERNRAPKDRHTLRLAPAAAWAYAHPDDLNAYLRGELDDDRLLKLARAFMALKWRDAARQDEPRIFESRGRDTAEPALPGLYGLLRLAVPFSDVPAGHLAVYDRLTKRHESIDVPALEVKLDAAVLERLLAEDLSGAFRVASDRLKIAGLRPRLLLAAAPHGDFVRRLSAALIFPMRDHDLRTLALRLTKPEATEPEDLDDDDDLQEPQEPQEPGPSSAS